MVAETTTIVAAVITMRVMSATVGMTAVVLRAEKVIVCALKTVVMVI